MKEYILQGVKKVNGLFDVTKACLMVPGERNPYWCFNYVTKGGWKSNKRVILDLEVIEERIIEFEDQTETEYVLSEKSGEMLLKEYRGGKRYISPEAKAADRNAAGWNYVCQNYINDPYDRG